MKYLSTRGSAPALDFEQVTLAGLASDGGLYVPESWPQFSADDIRGLAGLSYVETRGAKVMAAVRTAGSLTEDELRELCAAAYGRFSHAAVTPLTQLDHQHWLLELFHGPTLAFKDVALQLLGHAVREVPAGRDKALTIVGATSGDTGSAAIHAVAGRENIEIFMLHPHGRVSDVQRRQMTTVLAPNVHNIAIDGSFDDAQAMVKRDVRRCRSSPARYNLSAVNSINWARLMAQVVYYFWPPAFGRAGSGRIAFSVPTGNFGDVFAGYVAAQMGLPVERLIVATNVNDILHRALPRATIQPARSTPTATPSMDIQVSSNFERLLFDLSKAATAAGAGRADARLRARPRRPRLRRHAQREGASALFKSAPRRCRRNVLAMRWAYEKCAGQVVDPHTAVGWLHALRGARSPCGCAGGDAGHRAPGEIPRCGRAGDRRAPLAPCAHRQPVRPRGALHRAAFGLCRGARPCAGRSPLHIAGLATAKQ
jgi:threonine synthase